MATPWKFTARGKGRDRSPVVGAGHCQHRTTSFRQEFPALPRWNCRTSFLCQFRPFLLRRQFQTVRLSAAEVLFEHLTVRNYLVINSRQMHRFGHPLSFGPRKGSVLHCWGSIGSTVGPSSCFSTHPVRRQFGFRRTPLYRRLLG